ncbi:Germin-like protein subfamily 1 member 7 [Cardamine amara subsp. amara]|uniref:Germin-like protein n=1 Tax=Cardamine amara subsp. amara TaxID=228776 RepID=A0ABD1AYI3_CARAN
MSLVTAVLRPTQHRRRSSHPRSTGSRRRLLRAVRPHVAGLLVVGNTLSGVSRQDNNRLFSRVLYRGDAFVFPIGMIHYHVNIGKTNAVTFSAGGSQNPGYISVADSVFGSNPFINPNVLAGAFKLGVNTVKRLQTQFPDDNIVT